MFAYFRAPIGWGELVKRTVVETVKDGCLGLSAQLAFYFFLAVFPALLFLITMLAYLPFDLALGPLVGRLDGVVPIGVVTMVREQIAQVIAGSHGGLLTLAVAGAVWSSSAAMVAIISTLNRAYDIEEWRPWWQTRLVAMALTIALSVFVLAAFALVVGGAGLGEWVAARVGAGEIFTRLWELAQWPIACALVVFGIDLVYHFAPNADAEWVWVTPGSLLATGLWLLTSFGFKLYIQHFPSFTAVYGAIGSVIVVLLWFYLSGLAMLIGAELNAEIDRAIPERDERPQGPNRRKKIGRAAEKAHAADPR